MSHRTERVADVIRETLSELIRNELRDPRVGFVTVTDVTVTPDLRYAKVYVSTLEESDKRERTLAGLRAASSFLRGAVGREARLKHAPELEFHYDTAIETGRRVEELLSGLHLPEESAATPGDEDPE